MANPGAQNGIVGQSFGVDVPQATLPDDKLTEEKKVARFSKTAEFKKLKEHMEGRIAYYQTHLPDGREIEKDPSINDWVIANTIIREFKAVISAYEQVAKVVDNA